MMVRASLFSFLISLALVAPVSAQGLPATGSLTIMSRPSGASFELRGDMTVVGRTPMTFARGLSGPYRISGFDIGYQRWKRKITLDGISSDTIWMSLTPKSAFMAGVRSLVIPGWGQFYDDHPVRGLLFLLAGAGAGTGIGFAEWRYRDRLDDFATATTPAAALQAANEVADARDFRKVMFMVGAGVVGLSVIEAMVSVPKPVGAVLLGTKVRPARDVAGAPAGVDVSMTLAHVGF